eukprot:352745-Chlamydomonas_euryale.AAC.7
MSGLIQRLLLLLGGRICPCNSGSDSEEGGIWWTCFLPLSFTSCPCRHTYLGPLPETLTLFSLFTLVLNLDSQVLRWLTS